MTSGVGHTVIHCDIQQNWPCHLGCATFLFQTKVHRHPRIDQGFRSRHRAVHLASRVAQGAVWRGQLHFWIHVEVGGKSELGLRVGGQIMCRSSSSGHFGSTHVLFFRVGGPQGCQCKTFLERLDLRMSVTTGAYSEKFYFGRDEAPRCPKHTLKLSSHVGHLGGCHKPRK
jgi:hypothetical protein